MVGGRIIVMKINELETKLNTLCFAEEFNTKYYFKNLESNESINLHGNKIGPSASTRKISILMSAMKAVHEKKYHLIKKLHHQVSILIMIRVVFNIFKKVLK